MDRAIKERLIGASVLVVSAVILIPWLLDGKTGRITSEQELILPGQSGQQNETRTVSLDAPRPQTQAPVARESLNLDTRQVIDVDEPKQPSASVDKTPAVQQAPAVVAATAVDRPQPSQTASNSGATEQAKAQRQEEAEVERKDPVTVTTVSTPTADNRPATFSQPLTAPEAVANEPKPTPPAPVTAPQGSAWAVQVGAFASQENAERLADRLRDKNYKAFVMRNVVDGRVRFRVRVGPVNQRAEAELLAAALQEDRQPAKVLSHP